MTIGSQRILFRLITWSLLFSAGCLSATPSDQPELGYVEGTVGMDGNPLPNVVVAFVPTTKGRGSVATTDAEGHYELIYVRDVKGAKLGEHKVIISTPRPPESFEGGQRRSQPYKELIPAKYNAETTLTANVQEGDNKFDFDLQSE